MPPRFFDSELVPMDSSALWLLFSSAFISSTLLPGGSEVLFAALLHQREHDPLLLLMVASFGNALGGMTSWAVGRAIAWRYPARGHTPKQEAAIERVRRYGSGVLLLSWLPLIGDPLCVAAGWLKMHWLKALLFIAVGKAARYGAILYVMV